MSKLSLSILVLILLGCSEVDNEYRELILGSWRVDSLVYPDIDSTVIPNGVLLEDFDRGGIYSGVYWEGHESASELNRYQIVGDSLYCGKRDGVDLSRTPQADLILELNEKVFHHVTYGNEKGPMIIYHTRYIE